MCSVAGVDAERCVTSSGPAATDNASVTVQQGQTATNSGTVSDPDSDPVTLSASVGAVVNNGDGTWSWSFTRASSWLACAVERRSCGG